MGLQHQQDIQILSPSELSYCYRVFHYCVRTRGYDGTYPIVASWTISGDR